MLGNFHAFIRLLIFFKIFFFQKFFWEYFQSVSLDSDQGQRFVGPDQGPSCLKKLSADDIIKVYTYQ